MVVDRSRADPKGGGDFLARGFGRLGQDLVDDLGLTFGQTGKPGADLVRFGGG
jgi:hypothetical protein